MTIETTTNRVQYATNATTGPWTVPFYFLANADLLVVYATSAGVETTLVLTTNYSVTGAGVPAGGTVTTVTAYAAGGTITILRNLSALQPTDFLDTDAFPAESLERGLDRVTMLAQQTIEVTNRSLFLPRSDPASGALPSASARASRVLAFDSSGNVVTIVGVDAGSASALAVDLLNSTTATKGAAMVAWARLAYAAGTVGYQMLIGDGVNLLQFVVPTTDCENVRTGVTAVDSAWALAMTACYARGNATLHVPIGIYRKTGVLTVTQGVMVVGEGSQGSNEAFGVVFSDFSNVSCFRFDGSGTAFAGTGGGLKNVLIIKQPGFSGGNAVEIIATSDNNRPGEMMLENVLSYGSGTGRWTRGFVIDGSACNTPGSRGVRTVVAIKCRFADVTTAGETIVLNQATHFYSHALAVDQGSGVAGGLYIKGICDGVYLNASGIGGTVLIIANNATNQLNNFHFDGKIGATFVNNDNQVDGTLRASIANTTVLVNKSPTLKCSTNINPAFLLYMSSNSNDVTGDGTLVNIAWNAELYDQGNNFVVPASDFNCDCAGVYRFEYGIALGGMTAAHTRSDVSILRTGSATTDIASTANPGPQLSAGGNYSEQVSATLRLAYGDVVKCTATVQGSTKTADIVGSGTVYTWFSGSLIS